MKLMLLSGGKRKFSIKSKLCMVLTKNYCLIRVIFHSYLPRQCETVGVIFIFSFNETFGDEEITETLERLISHFFFSRL